MVVDYIHHPLEHTAYGSADENTEKAGLYYIKINVSAELYSVYRASGEDGDIERENNACDGEDEREKQQQLGAAYDRDNALENGFVLHGHASSFSSWESKISLYTSHERSSSSFVPMPTISPSSSTTIVSALRMAATR